MREARPSRAGLAPCAQGQYQCVSAPWATFRHRRGYGFFHSAKVPSSAMISCSLSARLCFMASRS